MFLISSNNNIYGKLKESLKERENLGEDDYPKTISDTFEFLMKTSGELESRKGKSSSFFKEIGVVIKLVEYLLLKIHIKVMV